MTGAEALIQQGIEQGIEQGIKQGVVRAKQAAVLKLLWHQFTDVPQSIVNEISEIEDVRLLDILFEQALNATALSDIELPNSA